MNRAVPQRPFEAAPLYARDRHGPHGRRSRNHDDLEHRRCRRLPLRAISPVLPRGSDRNTRHSDPGGGCNLNLWRWRPQAIKTEPTRKGKRRTPKSVLRLPDLEVAKSAVVNSLSCPDAQRGYRRAIR
jgi:hypothetical protein